MKSLFQKRILSVLAVSLMSGLLGGQAQAAQCYQFQEQVYKIWPFISDQITVTILRTFDDDLVDEIAINRPGAQEIHASIGCHEAGGTLSTRICTIGDDSGVFAIYRVMINNNQAQTLQLAINGYIDEVGVAGGQDTKIAVVSDPSHPLNLNLTAVLTPAQCHAKFPESKPIPVIPDPNLGGGENGSDASGEALGIAYLSAARRGTDNGRCLRFRTSKLCGAKAPATSAIDPTDG